MGILWLCSYYRKGLQWRHQGCRSVVWMLPWGWLEMSQPRSALHCQPSTLSRPHLSGKAVTSGFLSGLVHGIGHLCSPCFERPMERRREKKKKRSVLRSRQCGAGGPARLLLRPLPTSPGSRLPQEMLHAEGQSCCVFCVLGSDQALEKIGLIQVIN